MGYSVDIYYKTYVVIATYDIGNDVVDKTAELKRWLTWAFDIKTTADFLEYFKDTDYRIYSDEKGLHFKVIAGCAGHNFEDASENDLGYLLLDEFTTYDYDLVDCDFIETAYYD